MDVVERVIRELLDEKRISEARNLLTLFPGEYPHLVLEVEYAAGNWKAVLKLYESLPEEMKERYKGLYEKAKNKFSLDYTKETEEAFKELERRNYQGAALLLESVVRDYPELVEAIALRYKLALQRKDRRAMEKYERLLRSLDRTHPVLVNQRMARTHTFELIVLLLLVTTVLISLVSLFRTPNDEEIADALVKTLSPRLERIETNVMNEGNKMRASLETLGTELKENVKVMSDGINEVKDRLAALEEKVASFERSLQARTTAGAGTSSGKIDKAKNLWLSGYILYLRRNYSAAIERFELAIAELGDDDVYFKDDTYYYRALSHYYKGDKDRARELFNEFIEKFPTSEYVKHAKYFLARL